MKICGSFWYPAKTATVGKLVLGGEEIADQVAAISELDLAREQQHAAIDLRTARLDRYVEPVFGVGAVDERLVIASGLGIGEPVGGEGHLIVRQGRRRKSESRRQSQEPPDA